MGKLGNQNSDPQRSRKQANGNYGDQTSDPSKVATQNGQQSRLWKYGDLSSHASPRQGKSLWPRHRSVQKTVGCNRELKQPRRRRRQQKPHKFAYLTMKNSIFARFVRAFFMFWHFEDVLVLSKTWNDLFCSCVDDVSIVMMTNVQFCLLMPQALVPI